MPGRNGDHGDDLRPPKVCTAVAEVALVFNDVALTVKESRLRARLRFYSLSAKWKRQTQD